jgi:hypothetical protein
MAPGSKSRLAILRTSDIFIRVASILTHFEALQPEVRARWFIASRREKGYRKTDGPPADRDTQVAVESHRQTQYLPYFLCLPWHADERKLQKVPAGDDITVPGEI